MPGTVGFVDSLPDDDRRATIQACTRRKFRASGTLFDRLLIVILAAQVRRLTGQVVDALHACAETRVARRLRDLVDIYSTGAATVEIPIAQDDLAFLSGATRPTVNRTLQDLSVAGVVVLSRGRIEITDPARIARLAGRA